MSVSQISGCAERGSKHRGERAPTSLWRLPTAAYPEAPDGVRSRAGEALFRESHATCLQGEPWTWQGRDTGLRICLCKMGWNR